MSRRSGRAPGVEWLALGGILLVAALAYARVLNGEFQWDDYGSVVENPRIRDLQDVLSGFLPALVRSGRPVVDLTFALNHAAGGLAPFGYHLVNLAIHACAVVLVFLFTRTVMRLAGAPHPRAVAILVAGAFALHPLQTQAVSYVAQRAESLASCAYLGALLLLLLAERRGPSPAGVAAYLLGLCVFVLGLGAKVIVVTLPAAYLLLAWMIPRGVHRAEMASLPRRLAMLLPWVAVDLLLSTRTMQSIEGAPDAGFSVAGLPPFTYLLTQFRVLVTYVRLLFLPVGQFVEWNIPAASGPGDAAVLLPGAILAAVLALAGWLFWSGRARTDADGGARCTAAFGIAWFFLLLAPTSSIVPLADLLQEHRVYLASWGLFVAVAVGAERVVDRWRIRPVVAGGVACVLLLALALLTFRRNAAWETRLGLWSDEVARAPENWRAHLNLGFALAERGRTDEAVREYRAAYALGGGATPATASYILNNIGAVLANAGRTAEAVVPLRQSLELRPAETDVLYNLALLERMLGHEGEAEALATRATRIRPDHALSLNLLGEIRLDQGDARAALDLFRRAASATLDDGAPRYNAGKALARLGQVAEACAIWRPLGSDPAVAPAIRQLSAKALARERCPR